MYRNAAAAISFLMMTATAQAVPYYVATDIGSPFADGGSETIGTGINASGQVSGYGYSSDFSAVHAFQYSNGVLNDINGTATTSQALGINASGQMALTTGTPTGQESAGLYSGGTTTSLDANANQLSSGYAINNAGVVAGLSLFAVAGEGNQYHATTFYNGTITDLGTVAGTFQSLATAINNAGTVVGYAQGFNSDTRSSFSHAFVYSNGIMTDIGTLGDRTDANPSAVNDSGLIVGTSGDNMTGLENRGFIYSNGVMGEMQDDTSYYSTLEGVNNSGQIVGATLQNADDASTYGLLYQGGVMYNINDYVVAGLPTVLNNVMAINDSGQMIALGNDYHTYLLTQVSGNTSAGTGVMADGNSGSGSDVPEPQALSLGIMAALAFAGVRRRTTTTSNA